MIQAKQQEDLAVLSALASSPRSLPAGSARAIATSVRGWRRLPRLPAKRYMRDIGTRIESVGATGWNSISPMRVLERGYAMVWDAAGSPVTLATGIAAGDSLKVEFADGSIGVTATGAAAPPAPAKPARSVGRNARAMFRVRGRCCNQKERYGNDVEGSPLTSFPRLSRESRVRQLPLRSFTLIPARARLYFLRPANLAGRLGLAWPE